MSNAVIGEDPYPKLRAHLALAKHPLTYQANGKTICEECGTIITGLEEIQARAVAASAEKARLRALAAQLALDVASRELALKKAEQEAIDAQVSS